MLTAYILQLDTTCFFIHLLLLKTFHSLGKYSVWEGNPYCEPHYLVLFKAFVRQEVSRIERSTPNVTQTLVAKFQELESGNNKTSIQNSLPQNQPPRRIYFNSTHTGPTSANGEVFPSSGSARQLVERWNKMPLENHQPNH
ncbi:unnamed protein product [Schistosoma margrebowiei]|uniref:Uncharacterized protein n=1 Tax=Schistosoma margrebowiei TaxID=48269 RepID=A0A183LIV7_9TREM|nr:unnamed protein product [Schistosoma margrebowiei]